MRPISICLNLLAILFALILAPTAKSQVLLIEKSTVSYECFSTEKNWLIKFELPAADKSHFQVEVASPDGTESFDGLRLSDNVYFDTKSLLFDNGTQVGGWISAWLDDEREGSHQIACRAF